MKNVVLSFIIVMFNFVEVLAQISVVNKKGTITSIDTTLWEKSGTNIFNKNTGNVGVGNPSPTYKLDITGNLRLSDSLVTNTGRIITLNSGTINDSLVVADPLTGVLKKIAPSRVSSTALDTSSLSTRIDARVKYVDTNAMLDPYFRKFDTTSLLSKYLTQNGDKIFSTTAGTSTAYTLTLSPAITSYVTGQKFNVRFHLANTGASTININGLGAKSLVKYLSTALVSADIPINSQYEILYDGTNFLIKDIGLKGVNTSASLATQISDETGTGVVVFGTSPTFATSVVGGTTMAIFNTATTTANAFGAATTMTIGGTPTGTITHSYSVNATASGSAKTINLGTGGASGSTTTINMGSATVGATNNILVKNLISGTTNDSIVVADAATGLLKSISPSRVLSGVDTSSLSARINLKLNISDTASMLTPYLRKADTTAMLSPYLRNNLGVKYADTASMLVPYLRKADTTAMLSPYLRNNLGVKYADTASMLVPYLRKIDTTAMLANYVVSANNGLTKSSKSINLGGTLSSATTITTSSTNTLSIAGLQGGSLSTDSIVVVTSDNVLKRVSYTGPELLLSASRTTSYTPTASYSVLAYNSAAINIGTAYNTSTGVFTAPSDGLYQVVLNNMYIGGVSNDNAVRVRIVANGVVDMEIATAQSPYSFGDTHTSASGSTYVNLNSGQTVSIQVGNLVATMTPLTGTGQHVLKIVKLK